MKVMLIACIALFLTVEGKRQHSFHLGGKRSSHAALKLHRSFLSQQYSGCDDEAYASKFRTIDGRCNNKKHPEWGMALTPMRRLVFPKYSDGKSLPRVSVTGGPLPSARAVSKEFHVPSSQNDNPDAKKISHMVMQWGQFMDHDFTLTALNQAEEPNGTIFMFDCCEDDIDEESPNDITLLNNTDICLPIPIPEGDENFSNKTCLNFVRSLQVANSFCQKYPAEQLNLLTAYIDATNVYGATEEDLAAVRDSQDPRYLAVSGPDKNLLPRNSDEGACNLDPDIETDYCFKAGDERSNEQMGLASMHTVWMRQHNRIVDALIECDGHLDPEFTFQTARKIVGAMLQIITYNDFLPLVIGEKRANDMEIKFRHRKIYDEDVDPSILNSFATAAFRFGHSLIRDDFSLFSAHYSDRQEVSLVDLFGKTNFLLSNNKNIERIFRGLLDDNAKRFDGKMSDSVVNRLFEDLAKNMSGLDLAALNIQRGRDHGLPGYKEYRDFCEKVFPHSYKHQPDIAKKLAEFYGNEDDVDLFSGSLLEEPSKGQGLVGPTFACIIQIQFHRMRVGDRFWLENKGVFTKAELKELKKVSLSRVLCDTTKIHKVQKNPFLKPEKAKDRKNCDWFRSIDYCKFVTNRGDSGSDSKGSGSDSKGSGSDSKGSGSDSKGSRKGSKGRGKGGKGSGSDSKGSGSDSKGSGSDSKGSGSDSKGRGKGSKGRGKGSKGRGKGGKGSGSGTKGSGSDSKGSGSDSKGSGSEEW